MNDHLPDEAAIIPEKGEIWRFCRDGADPTCYSILEVDEGSDNVALKPEDGVFTGAKHSNYTLRSFSKPDSKWEYVR
jgi:hypothetical protein